MEKEACPSCGVEMEYVGGGYWECPDCGDELYTGYDDEGESTQESLSADDAALIWGSKGKDEDYMFGYSEDELEDEI